MNRGEKSASAAAYGSMLEMKWKDGRKTGTNAGNLINGNLKELLKRPTGHSVATMTNDSQGR